MFVTSKYKQNGTESINIVSENYALGGMIITGRWLENKGRHFIINFTIRYGNFAKDKNTNIIWEIW